MNMITAAEIKTMRAKEGLSSAFEDFLIGIRESDSAADDRAFVVNVAKAASNPQKAPLAFEGVKAIAISFPMLVSGGAIKHLYKALLGQAGRRSVEPKAHASELEDFDKILQSCQGLTKDDELVDNMVQACALEPDGDVREAIQAVITTCLKIHSNGKPALKAAARVAHGGDSAVCKRIGRVVAAIYKIPALRNEASEIASVIETKTNSLILPKRRARPGRPPPNGKSSWMDACNA